MRLPNSSVPVPDELVKSPVVILVIQSLRDEKAPSSVPVFSVQRRSNSAMLGSSTFLILIPEKSKPCTSVSVIFAVAE